MKELFNILHILIAVFLTFLILIQTKGAGLSKSIQTVSFARRGLEKMVFRLTFILAGLFIFLSVLLLFL